MRGQSENREVAPGPQDAAQSAAHSILMEAWERYGPGLTAPGLPSGMHLNAGAAGPARRATSDPDHPQEGSQGSGPRNEQVDERAFGHAADAAHSAGLAYARALPSSLRSRLGVFHTPPALARRLCRAGPDVDWGTARVSDPTAGFGALLIAAAREIQARTGLRGEALLAHLESHLRGNDIDPFSVWASQLTLAIALAPHCREARRLPRALVTQGDALNTWAGEPWDLTLLNPPYGRIPLTAELRARLGHLISGHPNLYALIAGTALEATATGGQLRLLTPASFMAGSYFQAFRQRVRATGNVAHLEVLPRQGLFEDALQETVLWVVQRTQTPRPQASVWTGQDHTQTPLPEDTRGPWLLPRSEGDVTLTRQLAAMPWRLGDHGMKVSTGPLVWNRLKPQLRGEAGDRRWPIIWSSAVRQGNVRPQPHRDLPGWIELTPQQGKTLLRTREAVLLQRTTAREQPRRLVAGVLEQREIDRHGGAVVENHLNVISAVDAACPQSGSRLRALAEILNHPACDQAFRCLSGSVAVSAYELSALPLPSPQQLEQLSLATEAGAQTAQRHAMIASFYAAQPTEETA